LKAQAQTAEVEKYLMVPNTRKNLRWRVNVNG